MILMLYKLILACKKKDHDKIKECVDEMYLTYQESLDHLHILKTFLMLFLF